MNKDEANKVALETINRILCTKLDEMNEPDRIYTIGGMTKEGLEALLETAGENEYFEVCITIKKLLDSR